MPEVLPRPLLPKPRVSAGALGACVAWRLVWPVFLLLLVMAADAYSSCLPYLSNRQVTLLLCLRGSTGGPVPLRPDQVHVPLNTQPPLNNANTLTVRPACSAVVP